MTPALHVADDLHPSPCRPALIWGENIAPPLAHESLPASLADLVTQAGGRGEPFWPQDIKPRVRQMLRHGKYKPAGRGKPASEFLLKAAQSGLFPAINPAVDANNAISLESGLPGTILDTDRAGDQLLLRRGRPGERYIFNTAGQEIDLTDLLLVARLTPEGSVPCGNPVKDSMLTKIQSDTTRVVAILYAPADEPEDRVAQWAERYAELLRQWCHAEHVGYTVLDPIART